ncbi:MAG: crossover junction endodeoxyribonuclease RuvC [Bacteroidales bacterium]|jgi:crossover junction endodeoxyribonuclease RuvC|nr:crossover junction endodeoxyribonuclease RuvC [Bacteroidales bacterium]
MIILGIDPGTLLMGYAVVSRSGSTVSFIRMDVLNMKRIKNPTEKLGLIHEKIISLIEEYHPDELSIESPFYGKNPQSLIKLGRAQGVAIAAALSKGVPVYEYAPLKIKQSITGRGRATKEQLWAMLVRILNLKGVPVPHYLDASDALGAAVCHCLQFRVDSKGRIISAGAGQSVSTNAENTVMAMGAGKAAGVGSKKKTSWQQFVIANSNRIVKK